MKPEERLNKIREYFIQQQIIRRYKREKKYDQIFHEFGQREFLKNIPHKYKILDIKRLKKDNNFELIKEKYGEKEYKKYMSLVIRRDVLNETGSVHIANIERTKYLIKKFFTEDLLTMTKSVVIASSILLCITPIGFGKMADNLEVTNSTVYATQLTEYNNEVSSYIEEFKQTIEDNNLTDLDIFMKLMKDMWDQVGYGEPEYDISGLLRLDIKNGVGVCRNMADDIAYKLNEINPEYNARTISVYMKDGEYKLANIEQKFAPIKEETKEQSNNQSTVSQGDFSKIFGNHAITTVDVNGITLVIDPTNPMIGVFKNGKIYILNPSTIEEAYDYKFLSTSLVFGLEAYEIQWKEESSFFNPYSIEELIKMYGLEAQNNSLAKIESLNNTKTLS